MAEVTPASSESFGIQIARKLDGLRRLYTEYSYTPKDIEALLSECERSARLLDASESQWSLVTGLLPPNTLANNWQDSCKAALRKLDHIAHELNRCKKKSKLKMPTKGFFRELAPSEHKDQLKTAKDDIVLASHVLSSVLSHRTILQMLHLAESMPLLQDSVQQHTIAGQQIMVSYQGSTSTGHVYHETHASDHAQVLQGNQYNHYYYSCQPTSHSHPDTVCEGHSEAPGLVFAPAFSNAQSQIAKSSKGFQLQCTGQEESSTSNAFIPGRGATKTRCDDSRVRKPVNSAIGSQQRWQIQYQSIWLRKAWHFETLRSLGSWTFCFRTWNVLEISHPLVQCVVWDNVAGFQHGITNRGYTINDRNQNGEPLFKVAIRCGAFNIINFYLSHFESAVRRSLDDSYTEPSGRFNYIDFFIYTFDLILNVPFRARGCYSGDGYARCIQMITRLFRMLPEAAFLDQEGFFQGIAIHVPFYRNDAVRKNWRGYNCFQDLIQQIFKKPEWDCRELSHSERVRLAMDVRCIEDFWLFWLFLGNSDLDLACADSEYLRSNKTTILKYCARLVIQYAVETARERQTSYTKDICRFPVNEDYIRLVRQSFELQDLQRTFDQGQSPLLSIFDAIAWGSRANLREFVKVEPYIGLTITALQIWLLNLHQASVDLVEYGQQEFEFFRKKYPFETTINIAVGQATMRLVSFSWGQSAKDWKLWWSTSLDEIGDTFLLDNVLRGSDTSISSKPSPQIPGAWIQDQEDFDQQTKKYLEKLAMSRRRRKRYLTAAGLNIRNVREVFRSERFHGRKYEPKLPNQDCLARCPPWVPCHYMQR